MDQFVAQANFIFQILILFTLLLSLVLKTRKKMYLHGSTMLIAFILNTVSIMLVMVPSLYVKSEPISKVPFQTFSIVVLTHVGLGVIAEVLAFWLIVSWRLRPPQHCVRKGRLMRVTILTWLVALFMGILLYLYLYTSLIP